MLGKLLGTVALSLFVACIYLALGSLALATQGEVGLLASWNVVAFLGLLLLQVLSLGSLFLAIGAACNDARDTQTLSMPVLLAATSPAVLWPAIAQNPSGLLARIASVCPLISAPVLILRMGLSPSPAWPEVAMGVGLSILAAIGCVAVAARIFRVGLLMQGKSASIVELLRWVFGGPLFQGRAMRTLPEDGSARQDDGRPDPTNDQRSS